MLSSDFLNYSLGIGFLILVGFISYTAFNFTQTLKDIGLILRRVDDITHDVQDLKNGIKVGLTYLKNTLVGKRGDKDGKK